MAWEEEELAPTKQVDRGEADLSGRLDVLVLIEGELTVQPLPSSGRVVVGRSLKANIRLDHESVSREHFALHLDGALRVEDLGGVNGTRVSGVTLPAKTPTPLAPGQLIEVGSVSVIVQPATSKLRDAVAKDAPDGVVADSPAMRELFGLVERVAPSMLTVLLLGETGVGKEILAEQIHRASKRAGGPYVRLNCAAIAENLLESELFGYEKGAFTGANKEKPGLLETAAGGSVFLDEVGEIPEAVQVKLLRVLEEREVLRVGGLQPRRIDVRIIAATNRDLGERVAAGEFRQDLYYRLNGISIRIPPLRDRPEDLAPLAQLFLSRSCAELDRADCPSLSDAAIVHLRAHAWPGNVRELRNVIDRGAVLCQGPEIQPEHLPLEEAGGQASLASRPALPELNDPEKHAERERILAALDGCAWNQSTAAKELGISRSTLLRRLDEYAIERPQKGRP